MAKGHLYEPTHENSIQLIHFLDNRRDTGILKTSLSFQETM